MGGVISVLRIFSKRMPAMKPAAVDYISQDLPGYQASLNDLANELDTVSSSISSKGSSGVFIRPSSEGHSLLMLKNQLLSAYLLDIGSLLVKRIGGESIADSNSIWRLIENRTYLERIRPLERMQKYQINKYLSFGNDSQSASDPLSYRADLSMIQKTVEDADEDDKESNDELEDEEEEEGAVYKAPRITPVYYDDGREGGKDERRKEVMKKKMLSSAVMDELRREFTDAPEEIYDISSERKRKRAEALMERERFEEDRMMRLPTKRSRGRPSHDKDLLTMTSLGDELTRGRLHGVDFEGNFETPLGRTKKPKTKGKTKTKGKKAKGKKKMKGKRRN